VHTQPFEGVGDLPNHASQHPKGQQSLGTIFTDPDERDLIATRSCHVAIEAVHCDVAFATHEPLRVGWVPLEHSFPWREPLQLARSSIPEALVILGGPEALGMRILQDGPLDRALWRVIDGCDVEERVEATPFCVRAGKLGRPVWTCSHGGSPFSGHMPQDVGARCGQDYSLIAWRSTGSPARLPSLASRHKPACRHEHALGLNPVARSVHRITVPSQLFRGPEKRSRHVDRATANSWRLGLRGVALRQEIARPRCRVPAHASVAPGVRRERCTASNAE